MPLQKAKDFAIETGAKSISQNIAPDQKLKVKLPKVYIDLINELQELLKKAEG
ncbi:hypothetical protein HMPREF9372_0060 [Sporosarcina newyorkensis 2681]|uniref:Uncharacterized protein n=1 Tax=Sporosarcina newyorkensis 2681 TaxID=1027292 RepID=F9DMN0_9BACL|nr:hypothetical protein [Sporosarcina newyorkensis]EGQ27952.1 hypothetical protein HMPREF9372_0060 [Sporosarcina newyorkensis 2681]